MNDAAKLVPPNVSSAVPVLPSDPPRPWPAPSILHPGADGAEGTPGAARIGAAILIVDDLRENLLALEALLAPLAEHHGLRVLPALTADEALRHALVEGERLAVVLMDVQMPGMDGPELARVIRDRRQTEHVPVIFVTALDAERRRLTEAYQSGAVDYLTKPLDPDVIRAKVAAFVEMHRGNADLRARERRRFADQARMVSDRARAESAATRARLALVLDSLPDAVSAYDRDWRFVYVNPTAAALLERSGRSADAVLGQCVWDVAPQLRGTRYEAEFLRAQRDGEVVAFEDHYAPLGQWMENRVVPGADGTVTVFSRDVSAQRRADLQLRENEARLAGLLAEAAAARDEAVAARAAAEEANGAKSQFLANMSHELRTPLNAIMGHVALVEDEVYGPVTEGQRGALTRVRRAQQHLLSLINDVLDFAKLEAGHVEYALGPLPLADALADAAAMLQPQMQAKQLAFDVQLPAPDVLAWADREKLRQVVLNLLSNAVKFTAEGGRVIMDVVVPADAPDSVHVRVRDTGVGIPGAELERVFQPFVQVHDAAARYTRAAEGTGLGLAISRDLARGMNGDLRVESVAGAGSTFTLALRRAVLPSGEWTDRRYRDERRASADRRAVDRRDER